MTPTTCLVTGCAGFVGSHLAEALLAAGHRVVGVDNFFSGREENMAGFRHAPAFEFHRRSVEEPDLLPGLRLRHPDLAWVFHLAAVVSVPYSLEHPEQTMAVNHAASLRLHGQARELGLAGFVFAGSAAEYGDALCLPLYEGCATADTRQLSPYGRAKYLVSAGLEGSGYGVSLRCFNIYGPRQDPASPYSGVISRFTGRIAAGLPPVVLGDGGQTRDFIHVDDVVAAYLAAAGLHPQLRTPPPGVYNCGTGRATSILDLARLVMSLAGMPGDPGFGPARGGDIRHSVADPARLAAATGFSAAIGLRSGLARFPDLRPGRV